MLRKMGWLPKEVKQGLWKSSLKIGWIWACIGPSWMGIMASMRCMVDIKAWALVPNQIQEGMEAMYGA